MAAFWKDLGIKPRAEPGSCADPVERVARALHASLERAPVPVGGIDLNGWDALIGAERAQFMRSARSAIEALRETTVGMRAAGQWAQLDTINPPVSSCVEANVMAEKVFQSMLTAALSERSS